MATEKKDLGYVKGDQGPRGFTYTPKVVPDGDQLTAELSWENDGELENPEPVHLSGPVGPRGPYYTPTVTSDGKITWVGSADDIPQIDEMQITDTLHAANADVSDKLGEATVGSTKQAIYLLNGTPTPVNKVEFAEKADKSVQLAEFELTNQDLDNLKGNPYWNTIGHAPAGNTCTNKPEGVDNFTLQIYPTSDTITTQILLNGSKILMRSYDSSWSQWVQIYPSLNTEVANKIGTKTVGSDTKAVYIKDGVPTEITKVASSANSDVAGKLGTDTIGSADTPIYLEEGTPKAISKVAAAAKADNADNAAKAQNATAADTATKLGTKTVGSDTKPIYLLDGVPTETKAVTSVEAAEVANKLGIATVGSTSQPIYLNEGIPEVVEKVAKAESADKATNAEGAYKLSTPHNIGIVNGSLSEVKVSFDGTEDVTINLASIDATTLSGTIPLANLPQGALERLVTVADKSARLSLSSTNVQTGDIVQQLDTKVMYVVVDDAKLTEESGYTEFSAGLATDANHAKESDVSTKLGSSDVGSATQAIYLEAGVPKPITKVASAASADSAANSTNATTAEKLGATTVGSTTQPIYLLDGVPTPASSYPSLPGVASGTANGLMSSADKTKLDTITGGAATSVVLANGTVQDITTFLKNNIATIRSALGVVTTSADGLVPKFPADPNA